MFTIHLFGLQEPLTTRNLAIHNKIDAHRELKRENKNWCCRWIP